MYYEVWTSPNGSLFWNGIYLLSRKSTRWCRIFHSQWWTKGLYNWFHNAFPAVLDIHSEEWKQQVYKKKVDAITLNSGKKKMTKYNCHDFIRFYKLIWLVTFTVYCGIWFTWGDHYGLTPHISYTQMTKVPGVGICCDWKRYHRLVTVIQQLVDCKNTRCG